MFRPLVRFGGEIMRRRYQALFMTLAFLLALVPRMALADTYIGTTVRGANEGEERNIAACLACGVDYLTMDSGLRAALFGSTVDGGEGTTESPNFPKYAYFRDTCYMNEFTSTMRGRAWSRLNDYSYAWALSDARADLQRALRMWQSDGTQDGGAGDGDGGGTVVGTSYTLTSNYWNTFEFGNTSVTNNPNNASTYQLLTQITLTLNETTSNKLSELAEDGYSKIYITYNGSNQCDIYVVKESAQIEYEYGHNNYWNHDYIFGIKNVTGEAVPFYLLTSLNSGNETISGEIGSTSQIENDSHYLNLGSWQPNRVYGLQGYYIYAGSIDGGGDDGGDGGEFGADDDDNVFAPPTQPDDTPTQPENPTQPNVTPDSPTYNTYIDNQTTTTTVDLTPILEAIRILNDNLVAGFGNIEEAISTCCENMRAFLDAWFAYFGDLIEAFSDNVDDWFGWYSQNIYKWLKQIDDDINTTSSQIQSWLQMIYNRMNGGGNTVPNPDTQTDDYFDWWDYFIDKLLNLLPDGVSDFLNVISGLKEVFPFSVPWDVGLILGVFAADPVTPVFDVQLPTYASLGGWQLVPIHVDLTPWDGVAQLIRSGVLLVFAFYLALWTRDGLRHFEV